MTRFKAAGIHLALSALIVAMVLGVMWFVWYPKGFFKLLGGSELVLIIAGVDLCLGPLLTLAVYKEGKKGLKLDLAIIAILQVSALIYGAHVTFKERPVFNVLEEDRFKVTLASEMKDSSRLEKAKNPEWHTLPILGPYLVAAIAPQGKEKINEVVLSGLDWNMFPELYVEYDTQREVALKNAKPLASLISLNDTNKAIVTSFIEKSGRPIDDFVYLPIVYAYTAMTAVLDAKNADFIEIIEAETH